MKLNLCQDSEARFGQDFEVVCLVEVMKLNLGRHSEVRIGQEFED